MGFVVLLPFTTFHLLNANWTMFATNAILMAVLLSSAWNRSRSGVPRMPFWLLTGTMIIAIFSSVLYRGLNGLLWAYPAMFMFFFVLKRSTAMAQGLLLLAAVTAASLWSLGFP